MKDFFARLRNLDERWGYSILAVVAVLFPIVVPSNRWIQVANFFFIYAMLGLSLNIILGYAGLFQLGHAAFYAVGAYTTAILSTYFNVPTFALLPISGILAAIFAILISRPILHLRGDYLCIVTIGFGEIVRIALRNDVSSLVFLANIPGLAFLKEKLGNMVITGGPNGIMGIARPRVFGFVFRQQWHYFYLFLAFVAFTIFAMRRLENSRLGRAWTCVREDELAAEAMGINTVQVKLLAFALGAAWAGVLYRSAGRHGVNPRGAGGHDWHDCSAGVAARGVGEHPAMANVDLWRGDDFHDGRPPGGIVAQPALSSRAGTGQGNGCAGSMNLRQAGVTYGSAGSEKIDQTLWWSDGGGSPGFPRRGGRGSGHDRPERRGQDHRL